MKKEILVHAYTKRDGTFVKEHYRTIDDFVDATYESSEDVIFDTDGKPYVPSDVTIDPNENPYPVTDRDHTIELPEKEPKGDFDWGKLGDIVVGILQVAANFLTALNSNKGDFKPQAKEAVKEIKAAQIKSDNLSKQYLEQLTNTKDQSEYSRLLKNFQEQKSIGEKIKSKVARIEYAIEKGRKDTVINELKNFQSDFDDVMKRVRHINPLNKINWRKEIQSSSPVLYRKYMDSYSKDYETPIYEKKKLIDIGMTLNNIHGTPNNAKEFWLASSHDFKNSKDYINQNGSLVYSISDLPTKEFQEIVRKKLEGQFNKSDTLGVILKPHSDISQLLAQSEEIITFLQKNVKPLLNGEIVNSSSYFGSNKDLKYSLGHADIIYAHINKYGYLELIILDTYDFNKNDPDWKVQIARQVEDAGIIREYYTLILVEIDMYTWLKWLLEEKYDNLIYK